VRGPLLRAGDAQRSVPNARRTRAPWHRARPVPDTDRRPVKRSRRAGTLRRSCARRARCWPGCKP